MGTIHLVTTESTYEIHTSSNETILEALRRSNLPLFGALLLDEGRNFVSLTKTLDDSERVWAYSLRNPDFRAILPEYRFVPAANPVAELMRPVGRPEQLALVQFSRDDAMRFVYESFKAALATYLEQRESPTQIQIALSAGGDSRVVAECARRFADEFGADFHCVICGVGFEDDAKHIPNAVKIAKDFKLSYEVASPAEILGMKGQPKNVADEFRKAFPADEPEVLGTYWVQEINVAIARRHNRKAIVFGFNQEDAIADRLYQLMSGRLLPTYPVRSLPELGLDLIAPLCQIPKRMLDALDVNNSLRNYDVRVPSVSYLRSSLYFIAYAICENFPAIADLLAGAPLRGDAPDAILDWLHEQ